ncbi:LysR family transcriptional regulator [Amycolatopsis lurida]
MDARQLRYFLAIVDEQGFNRAAERLHLAQPSLSQAIRTLERDLGVELFHRIGRRAVLTEAGHALIEPARQVLRDLDTTRSTVRSVAGLRTGRVEVASMPSQSVEPLSAMVTRFHERHPGMLVVIQACFTPQSVVDAVRGGKAEVGLLGAADDVAMPGVRVHRVEQQPFVLVAPPDSELGGDGRVRREELAGAKVIAAPLGNRMRHVVDEIQAAGVDLRIVVETAHREAILPLVLNGVGVAVMTQSWAWIARRAGARVLDLDPPSSLRISLVHRRGRLTPGAHDFVATALGDQFGEEHE